MINALAHADVYAAAKKLLDVTSLRQEAIAANIANVDTPGYRRVDVAPDFEAQLRSQLASDPTGDGLSTLTPRLAEDSTAKPVRPDGNTVQLDGELLAMDKNMMQHEFLSDVVSYNLKQLKLAITGSGGS